MSLTTLFHRFVLPNRKSTGQKFAKIQDFKNNAWQTETIAASFIKGSSADKTPAAAVMDAVINEFFIQNSPPGSKVMDVGCGHGILSLQMARLGYDVVAFDISSPLLDVLGNKAEGLPIEIRKGDVRQLEAADEEFDVLVARMFLGHFVDWPDVLAQMTRACRPGGRIIFDFTSRENAETGKKEGLPCTFVTSPDLSSPGSYFAEVSGQDLKQICNKLGLRILARAPTNFFLHNRLFGYSLGNDRYQAYQMEMMEHLKNPAIREFVIWFEKTVVQQLPKWATYYNCVVLEKKS